MKPTSLAQVVDIVNDASFFGRKLPLAQRRQVAHWIADRPSGYAGLPSPTDSDHRKGIQVFTGERINTGAGVAHALGEEACRALSELGISDRKVKSALERAKEGMLPLLRDARQREANTGRTFYGEFCCGTCSAALWRHLAAGGFLEAQPEEWLEAGVASLKRHRLDTGRWRRFPFYYSLLVLSELNTKAAVDECRHAAPACERLVSRLAGKRGKVDRRRREVAERVLAKV